MCLYSVRSEAMSDHNPNMSDDEVLDFTQSLRRRLIDVITEGGVKMPVDKDSVDILLRSAGDMDRAAIGKKRLKAEDKNAEADRVAAAALARIYAQSTNINPFERTIPTSTDVMPACPATLLDNVEAVPGELEIGVSDESYKTFSAKMDNDD